MIPLYKPYVPELPELDQILHSGQLATGKYTLEFEKRLQDFIGHNNVLATNTFQAAISVVISTLGLKYGDEIIVSPMACLASLQPYATAGLRIVWADIDPLYGTLDPDSVRKNITDKTRAIIHNHFCGYPGYIDEINDIGKANGIFVIDDGIECFSANYKGRKIGNCGTDITVFSFNPIRLLTTVDGGVAIFEDDHQYEKAILVRDCGIDRTRFRDELGEINPKCDITIQGYSATLSNVNAYIGIRQLDELRWRTERIKKNASIWMELIGSSQYRAIKCQDGVPNYWVFGVLAEDKRKCIKRFRGLGYYASGVHINNNIYSVFKRQETLPGVKDFYNSYVGLPCGWWVDMEAEKEKLKDKRL